MSTSFNGDEWRKLARRLGMTRIRIEAIEHDYHDDAPYYMLLTWFKRVPRSSDKVSLLTHGLININRWDLAQDLQAIQDDKRTEQGGLSRDGTEKTEISSKDICHLFVDVLKTFQTPFSRICQRDECVRIWKLLARELMLTNEDILIIEQKYPSRHERCLRSLEHWALHQSRADIPCLAKIMRTLGFKPLARTLFSPSSANHFLFAFFRRNRKHGLKSLYYCIDMQEILRTLILFSNYYRKNIH